MPHNNYKTDFVAPERWLDDFGDYLFKYAIIRLRDVAHAEDVVQETLLSALESQTSYQGDASEKTWLTSILKRKIIDFIRKQVREPTINDIVALSDSNKENCIDDLFDHRGSWIQAPQEWGNPYKMFKNKQFISTFEHCYDRLKPMFSSVFNLKEVAECSNAEICNELGITSSNLSVILYRARMSLRSCLELKWSDDLTNEKI